MEPETLVSLVNLGQIVDLLGTFVAASTGAAVAIRKELDPVGVVVLAFLAGTAGGIIRDLLIGAVPPAAIGSLKYFLLTLSAAGIALGGYQKFGELNRMVLVVDAAGLSFFAVAGAEKALVYGLHPVIASVMGVLTAIGGGIVRDNLVNEIPAVFRQTELYATAALAGSVMVVVGDWLQLHPLIGATVGANLAFVIRLGAIWRSWKLPTPRYRK